VYDFLADGLETTCIPRVEDKEGGLIRCFLSKIPFNIGRQMFKRMDEPDRKFTSITHFLTSFFRKLEEDFETFNRAKGLAKILLSSDPKSAQSDRLVQKIHAMNSTSVQLVSELVENLESDHPIDSLNFVSKPPSNPSSANKKFSENTSNRLASGSTVGACYKKAIHGKCEYSGCTYSHSQADLEQKNREVIKTAKLSPYYKPLIVSQIKQPQRQSNIQLYALSPEDADAQADTMMSLDFTVEGKKSRNRPIDSDVDETADASDLNLLMKSPLAEIRQNDFLYSFPEVTLHSKMHREGRIKLSETTHLDFGGALFDSGALHASYISPDIIEKHRGKISKKIRKVKTKVRLGDNKTVHAIEEIATLPVEFVGDDCKIYSAIIDLCVFNTGSDLIIGLPDITAHFGELFLSMVHSAMDEEKQLLHKIENAVLPTIVTGKELKELMLSPWSNPPDPQAPEDLDTPLPCSFTEPLRILNTGHEALVKDYLDMFDSHIQPDFKASTDVVKLLKTKGVKVFVPSNWEGIKGIPDLELNFRSDLPKFKKPRARPINPKLYEHARAEFERLRTYFYIPSTSSYASCLVIAPKDTKPFIRFCGDYVDLNKYIEIGHYPIPHVQRTIQDKIQKFLVFLDLDMTNSFHQFTGFSR
jgi:hypothetical protein